MQHSVTAPVSMTPQSVYLHWTKLFLSDSSVW